MQAMQIVLSLTSKFLAALLVAAISLAALSLLFGQTLLKSVYIENALVTTNSYSRLSDALADEISKQANPPDPTLKDKVKLVVTPVVLQQKITLGLNQLQAYYQGKGPAPSIPVDDLKAKAIAAGIPIDDNNNNANDVNNNANPQGGPQGNPQSNPQGNNAGDKEDNPLSKPITFSGNDQIAGIGQKFDEAKWGAVLASVVLAGLLLLVSWKRHRWAALPDVLLTAGILLGFWALAFYIGPGMAQHYIKFDLNSNAFASIGHDLAVSISHDLGKRLGLVAISYFVVGLAARLYIAKQNKSKSPAKSKPAKA
jgi:hypothetical protein